MSRRLLVALLALTGAILLGAVLPLGYTTARHDRAVFSTQAESEAAVLAALAEEQASDNSRATPTWHSSDPHDKVCVVAADGTWRAGDAGSCPRGTALAAALQRRTTLTWLGTGDHERLVVTVPVGEQAEPAGALSLTRSARPLHERVERLWVVLAGVAVLALLAAAALALWLTRWVARPLDSLADTAERLGDGALDARARVDAGPPEVRRLAETFDTMAGRLETLVHGSRAVVADVSHQLRTPLAALRLRLELLGDEATASAEELAGALQEVERLSRLVDGLLAVARAEGGVTERAPVDVTHVVHGRVDAWAPLAEERNVVLGDDVAGPLVAAATPGHLEQALDNVLANALDALDGSGHVTVSAAPLAGRVEIRVADDGPGMTPEQRDAAFHRFASTRADAGGSGLGLAIVHRLVTSDGGEVRLEDTPGGGLTVVLVLLAR